MSPHKLIKRLVEDAGGALPVAKAMGIPGFQPTLHKICNGRVRSPSHETARRIADHFGLDVLAVYDEAIAAAEWARRYGDLPAGVPAPGPLSRRDELLASARRGRSPGVPQETPDPALLPEAFNRPVQMTRETLMTDPGRGPSTFKTVLEDDALAPERPAGTVMVWRRDQPPRPGRPILVQDAHGRFHPRIYREGKTPGSWFGSPRDPAYAEFGSEDGAVIYASACWALIAED